MHVGNAGAAINFLGLENNAELRLIWEQSFHAGWFWGQDHLRCARLTDQTDFRSITSCHALPKRQPARIQRFSFDHS